MIKEKLRLRISQNNNNIIIELQDSGPGMTDAVMDQKYLNRYLQQNLMEQV